MIERPPWTEEAVLIRANDGDMGREIALEGSLAQVAAAVAAMPFSAREGLSVSLPNRQTPPYGYRGNQLDELASQQRASAPQTRTR